MGGKLDNWRFFIDEEMEKCKTSLGGSTFERGILSSAIGSDSFNIDSIEVFGCGGATALEKQQRERDMDAVALEKKRKVDKAKLLGDKDLFFSKTFAFQDQVQMDLDTEKKADN